MRAKKQQKPLSSEPPLYSSLRLNPKLKPWAHFMRKRNLRLNPKLQPWAHVSLQWKMEMMRRGSLQQPPPMLRRSDREVDQMLTAMAVRALAPAKPTRLWPSHAH
jgi:hypothetical protein